jgi:hypothetical protein
MNALKQGIKGATAPKPDMAIMIGVEDDGEAQASPETQDILDKMQQLPPEDQKALCMKMPCCNECPMNENPEMEN